MSIIKKVYIIALHLAFGGIEKAICSMANLFCEKYDVEIISVYDMPDAPAFPLDSRVKVRYLLGDIPNREEWKDAVKRKNVRDITRESLRSVKILTGKKKAVINAIKEIQDGVIITTRPEDNELLSKYGSDNVLKIAQLHQDHRFDKKIVDGFKHEYGRIDILAMLTPGLRDEAAEMMKGFNEHTETVYIPNFLEHYPCKAEYENRRKTVLAVGRLNVLKRFDLLVRQFAAVHERFPDWELRIVGEGEERQKIENTVKELSAEKYVTLTGMKDSAGVEEEMLNASVFAMSSVTEGFPFVLLEAQSCGLPIVAFDVRVGPGFVVHDGEDGFLAPEGDGEKYRAALAELMLSDELRREMSRKAEEASREFTREKVSQIWYSLIGE